MLTGDVKTRAPSRDEVPGEMNTPPLSSTPPPTVNTTQEAWDRYCKFHDAVG